MKKTKSIELSKSEKRLILLCKGHLKKEYPYTGKWVNTLKPLFKDIYGWECPVCFEKWFYHGNDHYDYFLDSVEYKTNKHFNGNINKN